MTYKDWLDELMVRTDIIKVISKYLPLTKKGASFWGCCPFHHEKTPSFSVNAEKQVYHCFGCKEGGNAITFIKNIESVDSAEAIRILAKDANMEPPPKPTGTQQSDAALALRREKLYELMRDAARHYHENLSLPRAEKIREYLSSRMIDERMIRRFGLGYSLDGNSVITYLTGKGYTLEQMKDAGIAAQRADSWYDVFYNRLIFPIINNLGEVVAFGGRTLEKNPDFAKYRNSSQTIIFDKSRTLYAVNLLKKRKQSAKIDYCIMTEGYMDVISLHKAGFDTAIASMGTALTFYQAKQIKNYCDRIYISYDGDLAGKKATVRGLDILAEAGLNVKVVLLPDGCDPDDIIKQKGADYYKRLLEQALTLPAFKIYTLKNQYDLSLPDEKSKFAVEAINVIKALPNPVEQEEYLMLIHEYTGYSLSTLKKQAELNTEKRTDGSAPASLPNFSDVSVKTSDSNGDTMNVALKFILGSMLNFKDYVDYSQDIFEYLNTSLAVKIYEYCIEMFKAGKSGGISSLYNILTESEVKQAEEIINFSFVDGDNRAHYYSCLASLKIAKLQNEIDVLAKAYENEPNIKIVSQIKKLEDKIKATRNNSTEEND